jgi:GNAT superfamily N-acetyltransferase
MRIEAFSSTLSEQSKSDKFITDFCMAPEQVRKGKYNIGLIPSDLWKDFLAATSRKTKEFWVAYEDEQVIGRIGASLSGASLSTGYFGFFEVDLDVNPRAATNALLTNACHWLQSQEQKEVIGPVDFNTWFPYRFRLTDSDSRLFTWEPVNPPEYVELIQEAGFQITDLYHSTAFGNLPLYLEKTEASYRRALEARFSFRRLESEQLESDIATLYHISIESFRDNFLFEPISQTLFSQLYLRIANKDKTAVSYLVENPNNDGVALLFAFLDEWRHGELTESFVVLKSMAVMPEARRKGLSNALTYRAVKDAIDSGAQYAVTAMVKTGNLSEIYAKKGELLWQHHYGLLAKPL